MEALIRWPQGDGGVVMPNDFIPVAEQRGLIMPIGAWVLREACRQNRLWQLSGLPRVPVAVNLSAIQFKQKNLVEEVEKVLADTGLDAACLEFELTESMLMEETLRAHAHARRPARPGREARHRRLRHRAFLAHRT